MTEHLPSILFFALPKTPHIVGYSLNMALEFEDIQSGILRPRTNPGASAIILLRIDGRNVGWQLLQRAGGVVDSCADSASKTGDAWGALL